MRSKLKLFVLSIAALTASASDFPTPYNSEKDPSSPMPAAEAAAKMKLQPGFKATVFAAEPDVQNPIAMAWDSKGRLWVAENYTYAEGSLRFDMNLRDRVLIFEDKNGDGHFDSRRVFTDEVQVLGSIEVGLGGVWLMCPPRLIFIPDRDGDGVPDGAPEVVLDGFTLATENHHTFANGLRFGPDGWLYGRCGASTPGEIGAPGTPAEQRIPLRGTMWRYHPQRKVFEAISSGTTNPWGHDWDENGELFFINTVNGHLWHGITGAHFDRPHTIDPNPRTYALIDQHADHYHFDTAQGWNRQRDGKADAYGGGHAHIGMMIYQGDNWPEEYRGKLFTLNLHGRRINEEILERSGSGYVGHHGKDFMLAADPWFRGMDLSCGPDGGVFVIDWSDTGECHDSTGVHRTSGRIYKITYGEPKKVEAPDFRNLDGIELAKLQLHRNEWFAHQARLEMARRASLGSIGEREAQKSALRKIFETEPDAVHKLRALWALYQIGAVDREFLVGLLSQQNEHIRAWAVRLLTDGWALDTVLSARPIQRSSNNTLTSAILDQLVQQAKTDPSGLVRLVLASTMQRLPVSWRGPLAAALVSHSEDANDHNLPLLIWYGLIPVADVYPRGLPEIATRSELPLVRRYVARRLAEDIQANPAPINDLLQSACSRGEGFQRDVLEGMELALKGWRSAPKPVAWEAFARDSFLSLRDKVRNLSVVFGDGRALEDVKKVALDAEGDVNIRKAALQTLIDNKPPDLRQICERLITVEFVNSVAARGLAQYSDAAAAERLVRSYRNFHQSERPQLLSVLVSRPIFADALLDAVQEHHFPRRDITAFHARQIRTLNDPALNRRLAEVWGELREAPKDKAQLIAKWKQQLGPAALTKADLSAGRAVFNLACAACHTLYGEGGKVGPDLSGAGRDNVDYLLENILDPSAVVSADFRMSVLKMKDGRVLNGLIAAQTERTVTLKTMTEILTLQRADIEQTESSRLSLMPEGLLEGLTPEQARDLIAYLMHQTQVPLPETIRKTASSR